METWKPIIVDGETLDYDISDQGRVINIETGHYLKPQMRNRYYSVRLYLSPGKWIDKRVHVLMAHVFIDNPENLPIVDHINRIRTDNTLSNLRYCTSKQNSANCSLYSTNTSGHKNIHFDTDLDKWIVIFRSKRNYKRQFDTIEEAIKWRDQKRVELFGEFA